MWTYNTFIVLSGAGLLGLLCGLVGTFGVLRRRALLGDVLAHATLPGLGLAFLLTTSKSLPTLLLGGLATGLFGIACLSYLRRKTRTKDDAAMGMVLAVFFGAGIALSRYIQNSVTDGSHAGLDSFILGKTAGMILSDVMLTIGVCVVAIAIIAFFFKEFQLVCFDTGFAHSLGWRVALLDFLILALLAMAVVVGLPMVGVVMVAALTIIPPVAARLWTNSLKSMLLLSALFGVVSTSAGVLVSARTENLPSGPMIVLCAAIVFVVSAAFAPNRGLIANLKRLRRMKTQYGAGTLLREIESGPVSTQELLDRLATEGVARPRKALAVAEAQGYVRSNGVVQLTDHGRLYLAEWRAQIIGRSGTITHPEHELERTGSIEAT